MGQADRADSAAIARGAPRVADAGVAPPSELDCLQGVLPAPTLRAAAARAAHLGVGADRVLIARGVIGEADYLQYLSAHTGIATISLSQLSHDACATGASDLHYAAASGIVALRIGGELIYAIAPQANAAGTLTYLAEHEPDAARRVRLTTPEGLQSFLLHKGTSLPRRAVDHLHQVRPDLSARPRHALSMRLLLAILLAAAGGALAWVAPRVVGDVLAIWFFACAALRATAALLPSPRLTKTPRIPESQLPVYSVVVAMYREASSVAPLLAAIEALDYPREKLDVIFAVEPNDLQTRAAIARLKPGPHVRVVIAPAFGPQTKPKALNVALPFARGSFLVIYDAEDRPEPGQLRAALAAFQDGGDDLACAQASLAIHNTHEGWFARMFGAEYAGQFDVVLPGLARLGLPLPLGGSSNHFRTTSLRNAGAWDCCNVTEDADLGLRLARFGLRSTTIPSTTWEEAPVDFRTWRNQRARWFKGWMQTCLVHLAHPLRFQREAGWRGLVTLSLMLGGGIVAALAFPMLPLLFAWGFVDLVFGDGAFFDDVLQPLHVVSFGAALLASLAIPLAGLAQRRKLQDATALLGILAYWACLSWAAWRALKLLILDPTHWDKTNHGAERTTPRQPDGSRSTSPLQLPTSAPARSVRSGSSR